MAEELSDNQKLWQAIGHIYGEHEAGRLTSEKALADVTDLKSQFSRQVLMQGPYSFYVEHFGQVCYNDALNGIDQSWASGQINGHQAVEAIFRLTGALPKGDGLRSSGVDRIKKIVSNGTYNLESENINPEFTLYEAAKIMASTELLRFSNQCGSLQQAYPAIEKLLLKSGELKQVTPEMVADAIEETVKAFVPRYLDNACQGIRKENPVYTRAMHHVKIERDTFRNTKAIERLPIYGFGVRPDELLEALPSDVDALEPLPQPAFAAA